MLKTCFLFFCIPIFCLSPVFAQNCQSGKEFWLGFLPNHPGYDSLIIYLYSEVSTSGKVSVPLQNWSKDFTIGANGKTILILPTSIALQQIPGYGNNGIHIKAESNITVYAFNSSIHTSDGSPVYPINQLHNDYFGITMTQINETFLLIVGVADNSVIEIMPSVPTIDNKPAGIPFTITLNCGETYLVSSKDDITGTHVYGKDSNNFAVFAGSSCTWLGMGWDACDHLFHQILPSPVLGKEYALAPVNSYFAYRVLAIENSTQITINGGAAKVLDKGKYYSQTLVSEPVFISSSKPVMVAQFLHSQPSFTGDPAMAIVSPLSLSVLNSSIPIEKPNSNITEHFLCIVTKTAATNNTYFNGSLISSPFIPFASRPEYSYQIIKAPLGINSLKSDDGMNLAVYGTGPADSYFFSMGGSEQASETPPDFLFSGQLCTNKPISFTFKGKNETLDYWKFEENLIGRSNTVTYTFNNSGEMPVVAKLRCSQRDSIVKVLNIEKSPQISISPDTTILLGTFASIQATGGDSYNWHPTNGLSCTNCPNPIASPENTTTYYYYGTSEKNGCIATDSVTVYVDKDLLVYVPNIFSPNGDGQNDVLFVRGKGIRSLSFSIYNRWGEMVFESTDLNQGWNGTFRGEQLPPSVFVYVLDAILESGQRVVKKGDLTLVR